MVVYFLLNEAKESRADEVDEPEEESGDVKEDDDGEPAERLLGARDRARYNLAMKSEEGGGTCTLMAFFAVVASMRMI